MKEIVMKKADDWRKVYELYSRLSNEDLYLRFFHYYRPSEEEVRKLVTEQGDHITIIAEDEEGKVIAEGTIYDDGEFSLVVDPNFRMRGIGTAMVEKLIELGKEMGLKKIRFYTLPENIPMIKIGKKLGFKLTFTSDEVYGEKPLIVESVTSYVSS